MVDHLPGRAFLDDDAVAHEQDAIGDLSGKADFVGDNDHCHAIGGEIAEAYDLARMRRAQQVRLG